MPDKVADRPTKNRLAQQCDTNFAGSTCIAEKCANPRKAECCAWNSFSPPGLHSGDPLFREMLLKICSGTMNVFAQPVAGIVHVPCDVPLRDFAVLHADIAVA